MQQKLINWLALWRTPKIGPIAFQQYLKHDPELQELPLIAKATLKAHQQLIARDLKWSEAVNCHILLLTDPNYPPLLKETHAPPPILFVTGNKKLLRKPQLAIVGGRDASNLGCQIAKQFAKNLAQSGLIITSGLARGIDTACHQGALLAGDTIAVIANGQDIIYPKSNRELVKKISEQGAVVTEFPLGVEPLAQHFPRRNRIISGLSLGVLVIEASIKSGSLITVNHALEQGREVFAIPGSIYDNKVRGCHSLIKQGAKLVENEEEILQELGLRQAKKPQNLNTANQLVELDEIQTKILNNISYETTSIDIIIDRSELEPNVVNSTLVGLELSGYITALPGGYAKLLLEN